MSLSKIHHVQKLFLQHSSRLYGFIVSLYPDCEAAQDLLHDVFLVLVDKAETFEPGTDFLAWARAVARLKVLEAHRKRGRAMPLLSEEAVELLAESSGRLFELWDDYREWLQHCVAQLTDRVRSMLSLRYARDYSLGQIAVTLEWSPQSVKVALSRARSSLRECMKRKAGPA